MIHDTLKSTIFHWNNSRFTIFMVGHSQWKWCQWFDGMPAGATYGPFDSYTAAMDDVRSQCDFEELVEGFQ